MGVLSVLNLIMVVLFVYHHTGCRTTIATSNFSVDGVCRITNIYLVSICLIISRILLIGEKTGSVCIGMALLMEPPSSGYRRNCSFLHFSDLEVGPWSEHWSFSFCYVDKIATV